MKIYKTLFIIGIVFLFFIYISNKQSSHIDSKIAKLLDNPNKAKYDFVSDVNFDKLSYASFPFLECLPELIISNYQEKECNDPSKKHYIDNFNYPDIKLGKLSKNKYEVYTQDKIGRIFEIKGYRDVNNDGYMDIIMIVSEIANNNVLTISPVVLTRKNIDKKLIVIKIYQ